MATLTFSIASTPVTSSKAYTLSDADVTRWINAFRKQLALAPASTATQVLVAWCDDVVARSKGVVVNQERDATVFSPPTFT